MSFLNLPWKWDTEETPAFVVDAHYKRYRRGPLTFYRRVTLMPNGIDHDTLWEICFTDNFTIGVHLPEWLSGHDELTCPFCNGKYSRASPAVDAISYALERCREEVYHDTNLSEQERAGARKCLQKLIDIRQSLLDTKQGES